MNREKVCSMTMVSDLAFDGWEPEDGMEAVQYLKISCSGSVEFKSCIFRSEEEDLCDGRIQHFRIPEENAALLLEIFRDAAGRQEEEKDPLSGSWQLTLGFEGGKEKTVSGNLSGMFTDDQDLSAFIRDYLEITDLLLFDSEMPESEEDGLLCPGMDEQAEMIDALYRFIDQQQEDYE